MNQTRPKVNERVYVVRPKKIEITQKELKEVLEYSEDTGLFRWKFVRIKNQIKVGDIAGTISTSHGYYVLCYKGKTYLSHRLAWLYVYGKNPETPLDHIDGDKTNNRIGNLRECSHDENMRNVSIRKDNSSGLKGVKQYGTNGKYMARIWNPSSGKRECYAGFLTPEDASAFYEARALKYHDKFYRSTTKGVDIEKEKTNCTC